MKSSIDWNKFKIFYYVAKAGSFSAAAIYLNISQPALSRQVISLEHSLKMKLFERVARGLVLTKGGRSLFEAAEVAFEEFERAEIVMNENNEEPEGPLKIATTMAIASVWLIPHISDFLKKYPKIKLSIFGNDEELDLKTEQADISIRPFMENQPDLIQELICEFHLKLYASKEYIEENGVPKVPQDLNSHRLIVFGEDAKNPYQDINWPLKIGMLPGQLREPYLCINTSSGMRQAAESGLGIIAIASEFPGIEYTNFVEVLPDLIKPQIPIYYVYPKHLKDSKRIKVLNHYLTERFSNESLS